MERGDGVRGALEPHRDGFRRRVEDIDRCLAVEGSLPIRWRRENPVGTRPRLPASQERGDCGLRRGGDHRQCLLGVHQEHLDLTTTGLERGRGRVEVHRRRSEVRV